MLSGTEIVRARITMKVTAIDPAARLSTMAWVSGFERQRLVERTKAGLERARRQGKKLGRPRRSPLKLAAAARSAAAGMSQRGAARKWGISEAALSAYLRAQKSPTLPTPLESHPS